MLHLFTLVRFVSGDIILELSMTPSVCLAGRRYIFFWFTALEGYRSPTSGPQQNRAQCTVVEQY